MAELQTLRVLGADEFAVEKWSHLSYHLRLRGLREPLLMSRRYAARVRAKLG